MWRGMPHIVRGGTEELIGKNELQKTGEYNWFSTQLRPIKVRESQQKSPRYSS